MSNDWNERAVSYLIASLISALVRDDAGNLLKRLRHRPRSTVSNDA